MKTILNFFKIIFSLHKYVGWILRKAEQKQIQPIEVIQEPKNIGLNVELLKRPGLLNQDARIYGLDLVSKKKEKEKVFCEIKAFNGLNLWVKPKIVETAYVIRHIPRNFKLSMIPDKYCGLAFRMGTQNFIVSEGATDVPQQARMNTCASQSVRMGSRILG